MKKKSLLKIYQLLAITAVVFLGFSCSNSFFDEQAGERITPDQHYKSAKDADISLYGAIMPLQELIPNAIMVDGLRSDQMLTTGNADAFLNAINDQILKADNPYLNPADYYKVIINVNEVLKNIDQINKLDRNFNLVTLKAYKGALIGLRSWVYLNLARLYGKAAWYGGDNMTSIPENLTQNMLNKDALIDSVINRLQPWIYDPNAGLEYVELRAPLNTSALYMNNKAVLGELYLEKNDYANAVKYLKMALESYGNTTALFKVDKTYTKEAWKNIFIGAQYATSENISVIPFNKNEGQFNPLPKWMLNTDMFMVKPSQVLIDSFNMQVRTSGTILGDLFRGVGISYDTTSTGEPYIKKYALDAGEPYSTSVVLSRATDVHLSLAEALNRSGDPATALILLNAGFAGEKVKPQPYFKFSANLGVRGRVLLKPRLMPDSIDHVAMTPVQITERIEDLIIAEKSMECAFEGKRFTDLIRVGLRRDNPEAYVANTVAAKFTDPAKAAEIKAKLMDRNNWYLPYQK